MESPQAQLCDFCSRWFSHRKLFPLSIDDIRYQQTLRRLEEIRDETQCPLCTLILSSLSTDPQVLELTCEVPTYVHFEPYIYGTIGAEAFGAEKTTIARIWFALIVGRNDWSHDRDGTIYGHGVQVSGERVESKDKQLLLGRKIGSTCVDQALLLSWLSLCTNQHGHDCTPAPFGFDPGFALRLIDVKRRCVVDPPPHPRYVALSYVWGNSVQVTLEEKHYLRLRKEGGLSDDYADIGTTIKDAMYLCEQLGEHYLWVDGLCIKQDDEEDRARQICSMNQIYSCAAFTIVVSACIHSPVALDCNDLNIFQGCWRRQCLRPSSRRAREFTFGNSARSRDSRSAPHDHPKAFFSLGLQEQVELKGMDIPREDSVQAPLDIYSLPNFFPMRSGYLL